MKGTPAKLREESHTPPKSTPPPPNTQSADPGHKKSKSGMPTRASQHKQGMAKEHEPEPAAAIATGIEGPRTDYEHEVHNADRGIPNGKKRWYEGHPPPQTRETGATRHQRGHHRHQTHKPQDRGHKKSEWYAHTRKHARARYGEGARAQTCRREHHGDRRTKDRQRERRKQRRHASAPPTGKPPRNPPSSLPL